MHTPFPILKEISQMNTNEMSMHFGVTKSGKQ